MAISGGRRGKVCGQRDRVLPQDDGGNGDFWGQEREGLWPTRSGTSSGRWGEWRFLGAGEGRSVANEIGYFLRTMGGMAISGGRRGKVCGQRDRVLPQDDGGNGDFWG